MKKKSRSDSKERELEKLGFEFDPPQDTFSNQPGSSGTIGGRRGSQEFGISGDIADEETHANAKTIKIDEKSTGGVSEFSIDKAAAIDVADEAIAAPKNAADIRKAEALLKLRFRDHTMLKKCHIETHISPKGEVYLEGDVHSDSEKLAAHELAEAILPGSPIINHLAVPRV